MHQVIAFQFLSFLWKVHFFSCKRPKSKMKMLIVILEMRGGILCVRFWQLSISWLSAVRKFAFQWVPAHVCFSGNEKTDRSAERGAKAVDSSTVSTKIGLADVVYAELTKQEWKQWEKEFHSRATAKEWDETTLRASLSGILLQRKDVVNQCLGFGTTYLSPLQGRNLLPRSAHLPSSQHASSARGRLEMRVRTDGVWVWDERLVSRHVIFTCTTCSDRFKPLTGKLHSEVDLHVLRCQLT